MRLTESLSIRGKLVAVCMTTTGVSLLIACSIILMYDYREVKAEFAEDWIANSVIISGNSTAAVSFNDSDAATSTLNVLASQPELEMAGVYTAKGDLLASFRRAITTGSFRRKSTLMAPASAPIRLNSHSRSC